ncbi:hypothetical protein RJO58_004557 [Enterobacter hormaechei]|nr:hypothetical protein [Enterobacter hormaechei]ELC7295845.1 hypothetical protein [Enterobacter hormaechei]
MPVAVGVAPLCAVPVLVGADRVTVAAGATALDSIGVCKASQSQPES